MDRVGLYIHIPFCERKCLYCDFYSGKYSDEVKEKYVEELIAEIKSVGERAKKQEIKNGIYRRRNSEQFAAGTYRKDSVRRIR